MVTEDEMRFEVIGPDDGFQLMLRRQGWNLTSYKPVYADPQVIRPRGAIEGLDYGRLYTFYDAFGDTTLRKLLRAVVNKPCTEADLARICGNVQQRQDALTYFKAWAILENEGDTWRKGAACEGINDLGRTLEWFVSEWFRRELQTPARHGVTIREVPSGDLDVVAFVDSIRVMVECKSGKPNNIDESQLRHFLQRAEDFNPEIAVLLIDTESSIEEPIVEIVNRVYLDLARGDMSAVYAARPSEEWPAIEGALEPQPRYGKGLYWGARHIYITNVKEGIIGSSYAVLRHYWSFARHQPVPLRNGLWDIVNGTVTPTKEMLPPKPSLIFPPGMFGRWP
jgi:hypothetical protein